MLAPPAGLAGLAGGGAANKAAEVFRRHDADASGFLDAEEMLAALQDLGMLEGLKARQLGEQVLLTRKCLRRQVVAASLACFACSGRESGCIVPAEMACT